MNFGAAGIVEIETIEPKDFVAGFTSAAKSDGRNLAQQPGGELDSTGYWKP